MREFINIVQENSNNQLFELFNGTPYKYSFSNNGGDIIASFTGKNDSYEVIFSREDQGEYTMTFVSTADRNSPIRHNPSGAGDQFNVISTIMNSIMLDFLDKYKPDYLGFSGSNSDGHGKLYRAVIKKLSTQIQHMGYQIDVDPEGESTRFSFFKSNQDEDMEESMRSPDMRQIMKITEAGLLPNAPMMIRIDPNVYKLMRALLFIANPEEYENNNGHDDAGMMVFTDKITYDETTRKLKEFGIDFVPDNRKDVETIDGELMPETDNNVSPYPNNQNATGKKKVVKKKKITPNPYKG